MRPHGILKWVGLVHFDLDRSCEHHVEELFGGSKQIGPRCGVMDECGACELELPFRSKCGDIERRFGPDVCPMLTMMPRGRMQSNDL